MVMSPSTTQSWSDSLWSPEMPVSVYGIASTWRMELCIQNVHMFLHLFLCLRLHSHISHINTICCLCISKHMDLHVHYVKCWLMLVWLTIIGKGHTAKKHKPTRYYQLRLRNLTCIHRSPLRCTRTTQHDDRESRASCSGASCVLSKLESELFSPEWARSHSDNLGTSQGSGFCSEAGSESSLLLG